MSHIVEYSDPLITDLRLLARACESLGMSVTIHNPEFRWFHGVTYPLSAIRLPSDRYERIGIEFRRDGRIRFQYDDWDGRISEHCGPNLGRLKQAYATLALTERLHQMGLRVEQVQLPNGTIQLRAMK